jgi:phenylpropionate dioxygenase-like ring-hydroxylating dioxygenase large terminal subunit
MSTVLGNCDGALRQFWHPVARADAVSDDQPRRVMLFGEGYVVWRDRDSDTIVAFEDRCPHRAAQLSAGRLVDGALTCAYHGWTFAADGRCIAIPAIGTTAARPPAAAISPVTTRVAFGLLWLALDEPKSELLTVPEWDDPALRRAWLPPVDIRVSAGQFLDNFCDFGHFPFVHAGTFGAGEDALVGDFDVTPIDDGYRLTYAHLANNTEDPLVAAGEHPLLQPRTMDYTFRVPFSARLRIEYPMSGLVNAIATWVQPMTAATIRVYTCMLRNDIDDERALAAAVDYEMAVLDEDRVMLERLAVFGLALDVRDAVHTRADRSTIEMRRCLQRAINRSES